MDRAHAARRASLRVDPGPPVALPRAVGLAPGRLALLFFRAFRDNTFLSPLVRVQSERRQRVVSTGVYAFVRHPMYLGAVLMFVGAPILLGSALGLVVAAAMTALLAGRILIEERVLVRELDGYAEYRETVRYRLIPFLW